MVGVEKPTPASSEGGRLPKPAKSDNRFVRAVERAAARQEVTIRPGTEPIEPFGDRSELPASRRKPSEETTGLSLSAHPPIWATPDIKTSRTPSSVFASAPFSLPATAPDASFAGASGAMGALSPKLAAAAQNFVVMFPPNAWPLLRAEGLRGRDGLTLRLTCDPKDQSRLKDAVSALRKEIEASGVRISSIVILSGGE